MKKEVPNVPNLRSNSEIWHDKMLALHGSPEAVSAFMRTIGAKGGKKTVTKGFGTNTDRARNAGKKSGETRRAKRATK